MTQITYTTSRSGRVVRLSVTPREVEVLCLRAAGLTYHDIAHDLGISPSRVGQILSRCRSKALRAGADSAKVAVGWERRNAPSHYPTPVAQYLLSVLAGEDACR